MNGSKTAALVAGGLTLALTMACVVFVVALLLIKALWAWTVPDLFPEAVKRGFVAETITWLTAAKVALFVAVLGGIIRGGEAHAEKKD